MQKNSSEKQLDTLARMVANKKVIPFLGAGTSIEFNPSWDNLIKDMGSKVDLSHLNTQDTDYFLNAAQLFENKFGRKGLCTFLRSQFQISEFIDDKGTADLMLMSNAFPITYTTNFDNVYETMMKKYNRDLNVICSANDFEKNTPSPKTLIKFHGDYNHPDNLIITKNDYKHRMKVRSGLDIMLESHLMTNNLLFIGYSFRDPDLQKIFLELENILAKRSISVYMIAFEYSDSLQRECNKYAITLIDPTKMFPGKHPKVAFQLYLQKLNDRSQRLFSSAQFHGLFYGSVPVKGVTNMEIETLSRNIPNETFDNAFSEFEHLYSGPIQIPKDRFKTVSEQIGILCNKAVNSQQLQKIATYVSYTYLTRIPDKELMFNNMIDLLKGANRNNISGKIDFMSYGSVLNWEVPDPSVLIAIMALTCSDILKNNEPILNHFPDYLVTLSEIAYPYCLLPNDLKEFTEKWLTKFHESAHTPRDSPIYWQHHLFFELHQNIRARKPTDDDISILRKLINQRK
ncbi:hypothetical protein FD12_GL000892 [Lentilactobacillus rapi DSM 19907 = JCM 15042]|uniref:Uncharacterized protein n=2 Tax=Lentilactobacillus rapi TaxID=481723 RepID=A0A512PMI3_9LACO|nr:SIR2 family protein [Lentilactobacillus rapi]KRL18052.1 hypothetical protein FD12_GL000892 [Lentilactobacillus rapi DSM 19907 = JCM 15042]GEP72402.1 hypothetical protein LRA02_12700 [Lentilactobacillus rapi]